MDIRQLRYFLAIAKEGQITRAAKSLNIEQPPLSRQLKLMEEELGTKLFERTNRRLILTQEGKVLQRRAESLLNHFNDTIAEIKNINEGIRGTLSIGSVFSCVSLLPAKIKTFRQIYPDATLRIVEGDHILLGEQLEKRNVELVVTRLPFEAEIAYDQYEVMKLPSDPFVAIVPQHWNFPDAHIHLNELAERPLLALKSEKTVRLNEKIVQECRRFGFEPRIVCECASVAIIISLVVAGIGAAILPKSVMSSFPISNIRMLDIKDTAIQSEVGIVWLKERSLPNIAHNFLEIFRGQMESQIIE